MQKVEINKPEDMSIVSEMVLKNSKENKCLVLLLNGDLGSGKTTFVQSLAKNLNITKPVISPTFIIHRQYNIKGSNYLHHLDAYRLSDFQELYEIINDGLIKSGNIIAIEWADNFSELLEKVKSQPNVRVISLDFEHVSEKERLVTMVLH